MKLQIKLIHVKFVVIKFEIFLIYCVGQWERKSDEGGFVCKWERRYGIEWEGRREMNM